jgi:hypothetical protein
MNIHRLNTKWIRFWMAALSAGALACEGSSSDAGPPGAGGSGGTGGSPSEFAGGSGGTGGSASGGGAGSPSDGTGGSAGGGEAGSASGGEAGSPSDGDPGDTDVEWLSVAGGSFPGGDGTATPCDDVEAVLLHDQAELDQWAIDQGIGADLEFIVDWSTETALGAVTLCSTSGHVLDGGDLTHDGSGGLTAEFTVTDVLPTFGVSTTVWRVFSVEGRTWTGVSATTIE